jgi:endonuclease/exonuclease/phosphatase family metal-dependent hydrolase
LKLCLLTYNIHRAIGLDRRFRPERIVEVLRHHQPDVALLQEVDDGVPRSRRLDLAAELAFAAGYPYVAVGYNVRLTEGRYGNATLSRHPIVAQRNLDLRVGVRKPRGCLFTALEVESPARARRVALFNLHLGLSAFERGQQVRRLAASEEFAALALEDHCVVGGDFNDWRSLLWPVFVRALGFHCATQLARERPRCFSTYPCFAPRGALDRIYYRGPLRLVDAHASRLRVARVASDHLPVVAEFELR